MKILYIVNADWVLAQHRMPVLLQVKSMGHQVIVAGNDTGNSNIYTENGIQFIDWDVSRSGTSIIAEVVSIFKLYKIIKSIEPDLVHCVTIKAVIYGGLVSRLITIRKMVHSISGLGYVFLGDNKLLRYLVKKLYRFILGQGKSVVIFENPDDKEYFIKEGIVSEVNCIFIESGVGVDCGRYSFNNLPSNDFVIVLPGRMLWHKGVGEFVEASKILKRKHLHAIKFILVGRIDPGNPASINQETLEEWVRSGLVEWWGHRSDMVEVYKESTIVVLPSYREGLPTVLMEAAASGRPIITTNVPGCKMMIRDSRNGILVEAHDALGLANAIEKLYGNRDLLELMGLNSREIAETHYSIEKTVNETIKLYGIN